LKLVKRMDAAVVGAGPFGLSVAAHLAPRAAVRVFGAPMLTWREYMPTDLRLRSDWAHTNLSAPHGAGTLDDWVVATRAARVEPIPLELFLRYADWFRERFVGETDTADATSIERHGDGFRVATTAGAEHLAREVVLAVGVMPFPRVPRAFEHVEDERVVYALANHEGRSLAGRRVVIVGGANNAAESAFRALEQGAASVDMIVRSQMRWFVEREPHTERGPLGRRLYRLAYPVVGFGPPPINRFAMHPDLFARLPERARSRILARLLRPGAAPWLRERVEGRVALRERCEVEAVEPAQDALRLRLSDGATLEADVCIVAAGYRFDVERLGFLAPDLRARVRSRDGWPLLDGSFTTTVPRLRMVGYAAEQRFGPMSRFVEGARFAATRVADTFTVPQR